MLRSWIINTIAVFVLSYILPGVHVDSFFAAAIVAIVLGVLNTIVRPVLILLTIPVTVITLGLFLLVINALMVELTSYLVDGFYVSSLLWALLFSIGLSLISGLFGRKN